MKDPEGFDRRLFLRGLMLTAAGLVVPKPIMVAVPEVVDVLGELWDDDHGSPAEEIASTALADFNDFVKETRPEYLVSFKELVDDAKERTYFLEKLLRA